MSDIYYDTYMEGDAPTEEKSKAAKVVKLIFKTAGILLVAAVFFILFYRIWEMKEPSGTGKFLFTENILRAYDASGKTEINPLYAKDPYVYEYESLVSVTLTKKGDTKEDYQTVTVPVSEYYSSRGFDVFTANTGSYTVTDEDGKPQTVSCSGYYDVKGSAVEGALAVSHVYLVPFADTVELTFRYKSDFLEKLKGHTDEEGRIFTLTLSDNDDNVYTDYSFKTAEKGVYRYITMVFENVGLSSVSKLWLDVHYLDENYEKASLSVPLYDDGLALPLLKEEETERNEPAVLENYFSDEK